MAIPTRLLTLLQVYGDYNVLEEELAAHLQTLAPSKIPYIHIDPVFGKILVTGQFSGAVLEFLETRGF